MLHGNNTDCASAPCVGHRSRSHGGELQIYQSGYTGVGGFNANTPSTPGHVFQVTCTADCGSFTWADKTGNLPDIPVDSIIVNPNNAQQVYAGTDWGVYYTDDITVASPTWQRFENGIPHAMVWDMQIDRGSTTLSVWTRSRGAYVYPLPGAVTPIPTPTATPTLRNSHCHGNLLLHRHRDLHPHRELRRRRGRVLRRRRGRSTQLAAITDLLAKETVGWIFGDAVFRLKDNGAQLDTSEQWLGMWKY